MTIESVPTTYGNSTRLRVPLVATAIAAHTDRRKVQNSSEPTCPAHSAVILYAIGRFALVNDATCSNERSDETSATTSPVVASTTHANVA